MNPPPAPSVMAREIELYAFPVICSMLPPFKATPVPAAPNAPSLATERVVALFTVVPPEKPLDGDESTSVPPPATMMLLVADSAILPAIVPAAPGETVKVVEPPIMKSAPPAALPAAPECAWPLPPPAPPVSEPASIDELAKVTVARSE